MLSYRTERPRCRVRYFSPKVEDWNWETIFYEHYRSIFNHCNIIGLKIYRIRWKKTQNKGYYGVQGHRDQYQSKARMRLPISNWHPISYRVGVMAAYCSNFGHFAFLSPPPFGGFETTYDVHPGLIGKRVVDFLLVLIQLFSLGVTAESLRAKRNRKSAISLIRGQFDPKFQVQAVPWPIIFAQIVWPMNAWPLCCWQFSHKETL